MFKGGGGTDKESVYFMSRTQRTEYASALEAAPAGETVIQSSPFCPFTWNDRPQNAPPAMEELGELLQ